MKKNVLKIALLVLVLIIPAIVFCIDYTKYSLRDLAQYSITDGNRAHERSPYQSLRRDSVRVKDKLKNLDPKWEYVKNTIFNHDLDNRKSYFPDKLKRTILISLKGSTKEDDLIVQSIIEELREIITTRKIIFSSDLTKVEGNNIQSKELKDSAYNTTVPSIIFIDFLTIEKVEEIEQKGSKKLNGDYRTEGRWSRNNQQIYAIYPSGNELSFEEKREYLQYKILRRLCLTFPMSSGLGPILGYSHENIFHWGNRNPWGRKFTEQDKFLLQKLYADDFKEQFSDYMYRAYSYRYASFFINPDLAKLRVVFGLLLLGILVFAITFSFFQNYKFKYSYLNYLLPCFVIAVYLANFVCIYLYMVNMELTRHIETLLASYVIAIILALFFSFLLWGIERIVIKEKQNFSYRLTIKMLITFLVLNFPLAIYHMLYVLYFKRAKIYLERDNYLFYLFVFIPASSLAVLRGLLIYMNHISKSLVNEKEVELSLLKEANAQSELKLLQSHINPHFLYNALNSIAGLAHQNPDKTENMALSLSNLFKYSINKKGQKMSTVKDEVLMVENYLEIEKIRFGDRLNFSLEVDQSVEKELIPMYVLQPLVENAIKHGISHIRGAGFVTLEIKKEGNQIMINVSDNGPEFPEGLVSGHGLQTVYDLLRLSYGEKASLKWENTPVKQISILIINLA